MVGSTLDTMGSAYLCHALDVLGMSADEAGLLLLVVLRHGDCDCVCDHEVAVWMILIGGAGEIVDAL